MVGQATFTLTGQDLMRLCKADKPHSMSVALHRLPDDAAVVSLVVRPGGTALGVVVESEAFPVTPQPTELAAPVFQLITSEQAG